LAMMKIRLSAHAADPARRDAQAKSAEMDRIVAPPQEGLP